jgi:hypothetical protein
MERLESMRKNQQTTSKKHAQTNLQFNQKSYNLKTTIQPTNYTKNTKEEKIKPGDPLAHRMRSTPLPIRLVLVCLVCFVGQLVFQVQPQSPKISL